MKRSQIWLACSSLKIAFQANLRVFRERCRADLNAYGFHVIAGLSGAFSQYVVLTSSRCISWPLLGSPPPQCPPTFKCCEEDLVLRVVVACAVLYQPLPVSSGPATAESEAGHQNPAPQSVSAAVESVDRGDVRSCRNSAQRAFFRARTLALVSFLCRRYQLWTSALWRGQRKA